MLMSAKRYRETNFEPESRPAIATINSWIRTGKINGEQIGNLYFVVTNDPMPESKSITEPDFTQI